MIFPEGYGAETGAGKGPVHRRNGRELMELIKRKKLEILALVMGVVTGALVITGALNSPDAYLTDALYQRPVAVNNQIKIIAIEEKTLAALGPFNRWDRSVYGNLLHVLEDQPAVVGFDLLFTGDAGVNGDIAFAKEAAGAGNVVAAVNMVFKDRIRTDAQGKKYLDPLYLDRIEYPYRALKDAVNTGFANTIQDQRDNRVREAWLYLGESEKTPAFFLAVLEEYEKNGGGAYDTPATDPKGKFRIRYCAPPGTYEAIPFIDVLNGTVPASIFADNIVLVGAYAPGMMDAYQVPNAGGGQMYGVEIHANIIQAIMEGRTMIPVPLWPVAFMDGLLVIGFFLLACKKKVRVSVAAGLLMILLQCGLGVILANNGWFLPLAVLPFALIPIQIGVILYKYVGELLHKRKIMNAFKQYVAPQVVEEIARKQDFVLKLGGERRHIAVLFVDIRGFTTMSESLMPEEVVDILNEYLALTTHSILKHGGTLDKFIGDATMAVFNSPFDQEDYIYQAVCTARDIREGSAALEKKAMEKYGKSVSMGIGIHCGDAVTGNIGCEFRMDYTAIGDTVNTASRLESNAKPGQILVSETVRTALADRIIVTSIGEIPLKGKAKGVMVYAVDEVLEGKGPGRSSATEPAERKATKTADTKAVEPAQIKAGEQAHWKAVEPAGAWEEGKQ